MPYSCFQKIKFTVFFLIGCFSTIVLWYTLIKTLQKKTEFSSSLPSDRCVSFFFETKEYAANSQNTKAGYFVTGGTYRIAICTDKNETEVDQKFISEQGASLFDPLYEMTGGTCNFSDSSKTNARLEHCSMTQEKETRNCTDVMNANPPPWGAAWSYTVTEAQCPNGANTTAVSCCAQYEYNMELGECPFSTVRLYEKTNLYVQWTFVLGAIVPLIGWFWEIYDIRKFSNRFADSYGDLTWLSSTDDGFMGGAYYFLRMTIGEPSLAEIPEPNFLQFGRNFVIGVLTCAVAATGMWGCDWMTYILLFFLFVVTFLKTAFDTVKFMYYGWCRKKLAGDEVVVAEEPPVIIPIDEQLLELARLEKTPFYSGYMTEWKTPGFQFASVPSVPHFIKFFQAFVDHNDSESAPYQHFAKEYARLTTIIHRPTTDPGIRSFCITWRDIVIEIGSVTRTDEMTSRGAHKYPDAAWYDDTQGV